MEVLWGGGDFMYDLINVSKGKVSMYISDSAWMKSSFCMSSRKV